MEIEFLSLSDRVYDYLSNQIIDGKIKYGEKLNIKAISEQLRVSTMPVRDALKKLEMENVVRIKPRSNCIVAVPTKKSILDAFAMRELLEMHAAHLIYRRVNAEDLEVLRRIVGDMQTIARGRQTNDKVKLYIHYDLLFHTELCALARNEYLQKFYREVNLHLNMAFIYHIGVRPDIYRTFEDHRRVLELFANNSPEALELLEKHLEHSKSNIMHGEVFRSLE